MNIIFLDIDGVLMPLGSHEYLRSDAAALKAYYVTQDQRLPMTSLLWIWTGIQKPAVIYGSLPKPAMHPLY